MIESIAGPITATITSIVISSNNIRAAHINLFANACLLMADNDLLLPVGGDLQDKLPSLC
jgi:hypothetical protein